MPRPQRCRRICGMPAHTRFNPEAECGREPVLLSLDEYESIRLMDREGLTHEQCAEVMPPFREVSAWHFVACHRMEEING